MEGFIMAGQIVVIRASNIWHANRSGVAFGVISQHDFVVIEAYCIYENVDYHPLVGFVGYITAFKTVALEYNLLFG